jgi:hypothetical protein
LSVISNAKPDLRDIRDPEKKRAAQAQLGQLWRGLHGENTDFPDVLADFGVISAEM